MPLSDEDRQEIEASMRKELVERERKAGMRWRNAPFGRRHRDTRRAGILGLEIRPAGDFAGPGRFRDGRAWNRVVGNICNPRRDCPDWPRGSDLLEPAQYFKRSGPAVTRLLSMRNRRLAAKRGTPPATQYSPVE